MSSSVNPAIKPAWKLNLRISALLACLIAGGESGRATAETPVSAVDFETQIRPILEANCFGCHGPDMQESQFRLDRKAALVRGGNSGEPAVVPGDSAQSYLIRLITEAETGKVMPPDGNERLTSKEIELLRSWIDQGISWPGPEGVIDDNSVTTDHWSFQPLAAVAVPDINSDWIRNPIDAFVLAGLRQQQLEPNPPAERRELVRRLFLDVLGLPPSPDQVDEYLNDASGNATERLIDRLLESPHYGERQARYWLDLVRFAESHGFETNPVRPHAWHYRDYVIASINSDKPYDQFIKEQLAGDSVGNMTGLGYLVAGAWDEVKSPDINLTLMQRHNELDDIINTTGTAFLGLTFGCSRCHNHKFDPITQRDYYALQSIFAGVDHGNMPVLANEQSQYTRHLEQKIAQLQKQISVYESPEVRENRPSVQTALNVEELIPHVARFVRFLIKSTNNNEPCIDELEIFSNGVNVALAGVGSKVTASGSLRGYSIHELAHITDGKYGNSFSWVSDRVSESWVQIEFASPQLIDSIVWGRDRYGKFADRLAIDYAFESSEDGQHWERIASSQDRRSFKEGNQPLEKRFAHLPVEELRAVSQLVPQLEIARSQLANLSSSAESYLGLYSQPGPTHRLFRGEPTMKREEVFPGIPEVFGNLNLRADLPEKERRLALAEWIASPQNPLTARVMVNRIWQSHFGCSLVETASDFGAAGAVPSHPELLDWLAGEFISNGWSMKEIHRKILNSSTYQQSSAATQQGLVVDASSRFLWRYPPRRLQAESIRDSILAVTGMLDLSVGGPGFSSFDIEVETVRHYHPKAEFGPGDWRRMIYMTKVRMEQDAIFGAFDCPDAATSVSKRTTSTTPLQALNLFNSTFMTQQAQIFSDRLLQEHPSDPQFQVQGAFELCYARMPSDEELRSAIRFIHNNGLPAFCRAILNSNEFVFIP